MVVKLPRKNNNLAIISSLLVLASCSHIQESTTQPENIQPSPVVLPLVEKKPEPTAPRQTEKNILQQPSAAIEPTRLIIPAINVDAEVDGYGINETGGMAVPEDGESVGWYNLGAKPGGMGNAVIAGHVDDYNGPAVFFYLKNLQIGDEVMVEGANGETLTFLVTRLESYPYDDAPLREIFGPSSSQRLNLITCTGTFNRATQTHAERLVVFTELKKG